MQTWMILMKIAMKRLTTLLAATAHYVSRVLVSVGNNNIKTSASLCEEYYGNRKTLALLNEDEEIGSEAESIEKVIYNKLSKSKSNFHQKSEFISKANISLKNMSHEDSKLMVIELLHERFSYKNKLRIARGAIINRDEQISKYKMQTSVLPLSMAESNIHLAFLFSSPLVRRTNSKMENIMQLDYLTEISDIVKVCKEIPYQMKYKTDVATVSNMRSTITD